MTLPLLIISRAAPQATQAREALNAALSAASLDQTVHLLFLGDGIRQIVDSPNVPVDFARYLKQLALFDTTVLLAPAEAMPDTTTTLLPVQRLSPESLKTLLPHYDTVLNYA